MISQYLADAFARAARALADGKKDTGFTSNGLRKLDFFVKEDDQTKLFTAMEQNKSKLSTPAKLAREGHRIIQIRDNQVNALAGFVDVDRNEFNSFENIPSPVSLDEIDEAVGSSDQGGVKITAARTAQPPMVDFTPDQGEAVTIGGSGRVNQQGSRQQGQQNRGQQNQREMNQQGNQGDRSANQEGGRSSNQGSEQGQNQNRVNPADNDWMFGQDKVA